jgi:creatinine amidohydrolase
MASEGHERGAHRGRPGADRELAWLTPVDIAEYLETDKRIILPFGATENNGPHLPLATDSVVAEAVAYMAAARTGVLVCPTVSIGNSSVNMGFPGTISFAPPTCEAVITDVCRSLRVHGFEQVAIVTGHYGNVWPVANVAETVRDELGITVVQLDVWRCVEQACRDLAVTRMFPFGHGGEMMTSILLHLAPEHVREDRVQVWEPRDGVGLKYYRTYPGRMGYAAWNDVTASGAVGDVSAASAERGEVALQRVADLLVELLEDLPLFSQESA